MCEWWEVASGGKEHIVGGCLPIFSLERVLYPFTFIFAYFVSISDTLCAVIVCLLTVWFLLVSADRGQESCRTPC